MKKTTWILASLVMLLSSCLNSGFKRTKSGLMYKIISTGKGPVAESGNTLKMHFSRRITNDTNVVSSYDQMPVFVRVDSVGPVYDPREIFTMLRDGDSAVIMVSADTLYKRGTLPPDVDRKEQIILTLKVLNLYTVDSLAQKDEAEERNKMMAKQSAENERRVQQAEELKEPKVKEIEDYLAKNNIKTVKAPQGTFIQIKDPGTGLRCDTGTTAKVRYAGKLFPSGKPFEDNMGPNKQAYPVVVGTGSVIKGWDEALPFFKKGGKGTLYVPFFLAYDQRNGPGGQPFENLIFDIEIEDVTPADTSSH